MSFLEMVLESEVKSIESKISPIKDGIQKNVQALGNMQQELQKMIEKKE